MIRPVLICSVLVLAGALLITVTSRRSGRGMYVSALAGGANAAAYVDPDSPTGYQHSRRYLIVPERHGPAAARIAEAQRSLASGETRARWTDQENAPVGRPVFTASPARWWLMLVAWAERARSGRAAGPSVERAALVAEPSLHLLLLAGVTALCAWRFGALAAMGFAVGGVTLFPFAASFLPGVPDGRALALGCVLGSLLTAVAGFREPAQARRWFAAAGFLAGIGLWLDVRSQVMVLAGTAAGGLFAHWTSRRSNTPAPEAAAWRGWSLAGAGVSLVAYLFEYAPTHLGAWELRANHPLYALAWLGVGELLARAASDRVPPRSRLRAALPQMLAVAAVVVIPLSMKLTGSRGFLAADLNAYRLTSLPGSAAAPNLVAWLQREGASLDVWATLLPLGLVVVAGWTLAGNRISPRWRPALAFAMGPVLAAGAFAWRWLDAWVLVDVTLLIALVAGLAAAAEQKSRPLLTAWAIALAGAAIPGVATAWPEPVGPATVLSRTEAELLIERDLAHWLSARAGGPGAIVYAPPQVTSSLCYFGGFRGLGTHAAGNEAGFGLSLAIAGARTIEEVQWALQSRGVRYVVVPSWDPFFDDFARLHLVKEHATRVSFFVSELRRWHLPAWLRPMAYTPPDIKGMEHASALVFEVVEDQTAALVESRLAEVLVETGRLEDASAIAEALRRFPGDVGALTARAQIQAAQDNAGAFTETVIAIRARLANQADRYLAWDRRVALAAVLAQGDELELARAQVQRCITAADAPRLRMLNEGALYRLLVLSDAFALPLPDPQLHALAESLLPLELRRQL
ncbi:hypothetical protein [Opitutus terrae]|uniref:Uncharacterized protein n=1 Tax=Opitutus terrae (strain DSM 11246 / JCM 15787 / PB90-1) TaxID=452637 RepID=B1ZWW9_OPITP|nr:hypothetical protein [Opitutus terrae]ACB75080.1 hypothetical protein Oter_1796 [Opitutus terrae PB90-1]